MTPPAPSSGLQKGWVSAQQKGKSKGGMCLMYTYIHTYIYILVSTELDTQAESGKLGGSGGGGGFGNPTAFQQQQQNIVWGAGNRTGFLILLF